MLFRGVGDGTAFSSGDGIASQITKRSMRKVDMTKPAPVVSVHLSLFDLDNALISVADT